MPTVRARVATFHNGTFRTPGSTYEITDAQLATAKARWKDRQIRPAFELVVKPAPKVDTSDLV